MAELTREQITTAFLALVYDGRETAPARLVRALCADLGIPAPARAHVTRELVRVMANCVRNGTTSEQTVSNAVADWLLDFAAAAA